MMIEHLRMQSVSVRQHLGSNDRFRFVLLQSIGQQVYLMANSQDGYDSKGAGSGDVLPRCRGLSCHGMRDRVRSCLFYLASVPR
jgi:hypothetical protein